MTCDSVCNCYFPWRNNMINTIELVFQSPSTTKTNQIITKYNPQPQKKRLDFSYIRWYVCIKSPQKKKQHKKRS